MKERETILRFTCFGMVAGLASQYILKNFDELIFALIVPIAIFLILIPFSRKRKENLLTSAVTFFSVWFVFWMILYGL